MSGWYSDACNSWSVVLMRPGTAAVSDFPFRTVGVGAADHGPHILETQPVTMQDSGIDVHPHRWQGSPADDDPSNALHLR